MCCSRFIISSYHPPFLSAYISLLHIAPHLFLDIIHVFF